MSQATAGEWFIGGSLISNGKTEVARILRRTRKERLRNPANDESRDAPADYHEAEANGLLILAAVNAYRAPDPYNDRDGYDASDFRDTRLDYYAETYPEDGDRDLIDRLNDEHKIWLAGRANDVSQLPRIED